MRATLSTLLREPHGLRSTLFHTHSKYSNCISHPACHSISISVSISNSNFTIRSIFKSNSCSILYTGSYQHFDTSSDSATESIFCTDCYAVCGGYEESIDPPIRDIDIRITQCSASVSKYMFNLPVRRLLSLGCGLHSRKQMQRAESVLQSMCTRRIHVPELVYRMRIQLRQFMQQRVRLLRSGRGMQ